MIVHDRRELWGWILFLVCALIFVGVGIRDGDVWMTLGSLAFLGACVLFLIADPRR
jgi:hypothetical protein